jgi:hypothetical protein
MKTAVKENSAYFHFRVHARCQINETVRDNLATFNLSNIELPEYDPFGSFLSAAACAIKSTIHTTLQATPAGQLVLGRDML